MTYQELMTSSLTKLLRKGETLEHPIYGILNQGHEQYYGYFDIVGDHLLIALLAGKSVYKTIRVPLDIKSVKIKRSPIFRQYIINISFKDAPPFNITAMPRVTNINTQKENLPRFLSLLKSKAPPAPELKETVGLKIRRQYFNEIIYMYLCLIPTTAICVAVYDIKAGSFSIAKTADFFFTGCGVMLGFSVPLIILSWLNRRVFGKTVCVFNEEGAVPESGFIPWEEITGITYYPRVGIAKGWPKYTGAVFHIAPFGKKEYDIEVSQFPLYGLKKAKKYKPELTVKINREEIIGFALLACIAVIIVLIVM